MCLVPPAMSWPRIHKFWPARPAIIHRDHAHRQPHDGAVNASTMLADSQPVRPKLKSTFIKDALRRDLCSEAFNTVHADTAEGEVPAQEVPVSKATVRRSDWPSHRQKSMKKVSR